MGKVFAVIGLVELSQENSEVYVKWLGRDSFEEVVNKIISPNKSDPRGTREKCQKRLDEQSLKHLTQIITDLDLNCEQLEEL